MSNKEINERNYVHMFKEIHGMDTTTNTKTNLFLQNFEKMHKCIGKGNKKDEFEYDLSKVLKYVTDNVSIIFYLLKKFKKQLDELDRQALVEKAIEIGFETNSLFCLLNSDTDKIHLVVKDLLTDENMEEFLREFYKRIFAVTDKKFIKNISMFLPLLDVKHFVSTKHIFKLIENESYTIRMTAAEIFEKMALFYKIEENIDQVIVITDYLLMLLIDVNQFVRGKALSALNILFKNSAVLQGSKNKVVSEIIRRILDKAVFVRKKAVSLASQIVLNFYEDNLNNCNKEFKEIINQGLTNVLVALDSKEVKTDALEMFGFIKTCYFCKVKHANNAVSAMVNNIFMEERKEHVVNTFKEIIAHDENKMFEFVDNPVYNEVIKHLDINYKTLIKNIMNDKYVYESIRTLSYMERYKISITTATSLLSFGRDKLFTSSNLTHICMNLEMYKDILKICAKLNERIEYNNKIYEEIIKDILKMTFYNGDVIKYAVEFFYKTSKGPDTNSVMLLRGITKMGSLIKLLDAVGNICVNQYMFVDEIERRIKEDTNIIDDQKKHIKEKERRLSVEGKRRNSLADSQTLKYMEIQKAMENRNDEEIGDFFEEIRENEILYGEEAMLNQFIQILINSCASEKEEIKLVANISLCKCMLVSSRCFKENYEKIFLLNLMDKNNSIKLRMSLITYLSDLIVYYNSSIDITVLFELLKEDEIKKNAMLVIFNLVSKNAIRIKKYVKEILNCLKDADLKDITQTLLCEISKTSNNITNNITYVAYRAFVDEDIGEEVMEYLINLISAKDKQGLVEKCKNICKSELQTKKLIVIDDKVNIDQKENSLSIK